MTSYFKLNIISFQGTIFSGEVSFVKFKSLSGEMGVYSGHIPMLTALQAGTLVYHLENEKNVLFISGGVVEIKHDEVSILADHCMVTADLNEAMIQESRNKAEQIMKERVNIQSYYQAYSELTRSTQLLQSIQELHKIRKHR